MLCFQNARPFRSTVIPNCNSGLPGEGATGPSAGEGPLAVPFGPARRRPVRMLGDSAGTATCCLVPARAEAHHPDHLTCCTLAAHIRGGSSCFCTSASTLGIAGHSEPPPLPSQQATSRKVPPGGDEASAGLLEPRSSKRFVDKLAKKTNTCKALFALFYFSESPALAGLFHPQAFGAGLPSPGAFQKPRLLRKECLNDQS